MQAIVFDRTGSIDDRLSVLELRDIPVPEINDDQVLVKMSAASVNPGDFLFIQSLYPVPKRPHFPQQVAGNHGAGIVVKAGKNTSVRPGTLVGFSYYDTWAEYAVVPADWLFIFPDDYPVEKAAQFFNFVTAWDLLAETRVTEGQWLAITAGNSAVSTMALQFAKSRGLRVISLVRTIQPDLNLYDLGAEAVIELSTLEGDLGEKIMRLTEGKGLNGIIDNVGGPVSGALIDCAAQGATVIVNGAMDTGRYEVDNLNLLMKLITIRCIAFRFFFDPPQPADRHMIDELIRLTQAETFKVRVQGLHPLTDFRRVIDDSIDRPEKGKVFFCFS